MVAFEQNTADEVVEATKIKKELLERRKHKLEEQYRGFQDLLETLPDSRMAHTAIHSLNIAYLAANEVLRQELETVNKLLEG